MSFPIDDVSKRLCILKYFLVFLLLHIMFLENFAKPYKGAELRTNQVFQYGRFEVRMKSAPGSGLLSSFFTYHDTPNVPAQWNEIDIEILGRYTNQVQFNIITQGQVNHVVTKTVSYNPHQAFHVYTIEWTPDYLSWNVDGFEIYREIGNHVQQLIYAQKNMMNIWPPDNPGWVGPFDPNILPVYAFYDWVKYYQYTPGVGDNFTLQWTDNFDSWNTTRWSKGTHTWTGNLCDFIPENAVFQDGYLVICLTDDVNIGYSGATIPDEDIDAPYLVWARTFPNAVYVFFSEPIDPASAQDPSNYFLPPLNVNLATLLPDNRTVKLDVPNLNLNQSYNLIASGINDLAQPPNTMSTQVILTKQTNQLPININVAGDAWQNYVADQVWTEEREHGSVGGTNISHSDTLQFGNTNEDEVYRTELRNLDFYEIRLPQGQYNITLMFAETQYNSASGRIFDVFAEGQLIIDDLNIYVEAGLQKFTAVEKTINNIDVMDGILELYFEGFIGEPVLSGVRIEEVSTGIKQGRVYPKDFNFSVYPNPFNASFHVEYTLGNPSQVEIVLYNIQGQFVRKIYSGFQPAGNHNSYYKMDGLGTGVYFLVARFDNVTREVLKAIYLK
jgi:hypothetical protein